MSKDSKKALKYFITARESDETLPDSHFGIGLYHFQNKDFGQAIVEFKIAKKLYEGLDCKDFIAERDIVKDLIARAEKLEQRPFYLRWIMP